MLNIKQQKTYNQIQHKAKQDSENSTTSDYRVRPKLGLVVIEGIDNERVLESSSFSSLWNIWCV